MDSKGLACWNLLFHLLIVLGTCDFVPVDGTNAIRHQRMDVNNPQRNSKRDHVAHVQEKMSMHDHSHSSSHGMHQMDPTTTVFFVFDDLKLGKTMSILFPDGDPSPCGRLLYLWRYARTSRSYAPFHWQTATEILQHFSFSQGSRKA
nr:uncharacterized protein LOC113720041 [Coffea arabica]